ncbi:MAG: hypothetical protein Q8K82_06750, partial [Gemmatimonadaceae bacterium]|nr:hypothetical protein [Gemmatimonadaceae bacterium]
MAALNRLAGGNPRTLGALYTVLESRGSADVMSQLSAMLDTFTSWYQARSEELPIQSRAVFDALALNWDPMSAAAAGAATGLETTAVSSHLSRLEKLGYVEAVAMNRRGTGRNGYQVSERFFNVWYLMRNGPRRVHQRIKFLTVSLQTCFSESDRHAMARAALDSDSTDPGYSVALAATFRGGERRRQLLDRAEAQANRQGNPEEYGPVIQEMREGRQSLKDRVQKRSEIPAQTLSRVDQEIERLGSAPEREARVSLATALVNKGVGLGQIGPSEEEIAIYGDVVTRFGEAPELALRERVAVALFFKGITLGHLGRSEEEM